VDPFGAIASLAVVVLPAIAAIKKAADKRALRQKAMLAQFAPGAAQLRAEAASPIMPPVMVRQPVHPARPEPVIAVPDVSETLPQAETRLIEGLFSEPRSLVAAFVASEILGPPVAFRQR